MTMKTPTSVQLSYRCCRFLKVMKNISNASIPFIQILGFIIWLSFYCLHVLFFDAWYWPAFIIFTWLHFCWVLVGVLLSNYYSEVSRRLYIVSQYFFFFERMWSNPVPSIVLVHFGDLFFIYFLFLLLDGQKCMHDLFLLLRFSLQLVCNNSMWLFFSFFLSAWGWGQCLLSEASHRHRHRRTKVIYL